MRPHLELIHQAAQGKAQNAPPLLFIHGAFCGAWCWQPHFMPWFAKQGYDCWALSLEGHGNSSGKAYRDALSIKNYVGNLASTISALPQTPIVIAHSMGGYVAQQYLIEHALPAVALLASVPPTGMAASGLRLFMQAPELLLKLNLYQNGSYDPQQEDPQLHQLKQMLFSDDVPQAAIELLVQHGHPESQRAIIDMTMINPFNIDPIHPLPALVLGAANDHLVSQDDVFASAQRLGVTAEILPNMGHMVMLDTHWEKVVLRIASWLKGLSY